MTQEYKEGDYVMFVKGKILKGAVAVVVMPPKQGFIGMRLRILNNPNHPNARKDTRIVAHPDEVMPIDPAIGQILDN